MSRSLLAPNNVPMIATNDLKCGYVTRYCGDLPLFNCTRDSKDNVRAFETNEIKRWIEWWYVPKDEKLQDLFKYRFFCQSFCLFLCALFRLFLCFFICLFDYFQEFQERNDHQGLRFIRNINLTLGAFSSIRL